MCQGETIEQTGILFDLPPAGTVCANPKCGLLFNRRDKVQKYCSARCRDLVTWARHTQILKEKTDLITSGMEMAATGKLNNRDIEAVELYKKIAIGPIAKLQGRSKRAVCKSLIKAGVYRPHPKFNGHKKKGTGHSSRILRKQIRTERRHKMAVCLWALRRRIGVERTCKDHEWNFSTVYNYLKLNKTYSKLRSNFEPKHDQIAQCRRGRMVSVEFKKESDFQLKIERIFKENSIAYQRESLIGETRSKVDFVVGEYAIECKTSTRSGDAKKLIGQMMLYSHVGKKIPVCLIPNDITFPEYEMSVIQSCGFKVIKEADLIDWISNPESQSTLDIRAAVRARIFCKCCGRFDRIASMSPRGDNRSYCKDCEPNIKNCYFDGRADRWVNRTANIGYPEIGTQHEMPAL